jgi:acyl-CoA thioester hydrolase
MIENKISFRVRYAEVDRMGYVHHGNYAAYFEMGRTELMREYGIVYKDLEDQGILLPLIELSVKYYVPALYDEELILTTKLLEPSGVKLIFEYFLHNKKGEMVAEGKTPLVFVDKKTRKPIRPPKELVEQLYAKIRR